MAKTGLIGAVGHAPKVMIRPASETPPNKNKLRKGLANGQVSGAKSACDKPTKNYQPLRGLPASENVGTLFVACKPGLCAVFAHE